VDLKIWLFLEMKDLETMAVISLRSLDTSGGLGDIVLKFTQRAWKWAHSHKRVQTTAQAFFGHDVLLVPNPFTTLLLDPFFVL
jgi:hypothetical protein